MKQCSKCNRSDVEFGKNSYKKDGFQSQCKKCKSESDAKHYSKNKNKQKLRVKEQRRKTRQFIYDYLKNNPCVDCYEKDPVVLDFDHLNDKTINVSQMVSGGFSIENIMLEISKCEVRCANCHRRKTAIQFNWYKDLT